MDTKNRSSFVDRLTEAVERQPGLTAYQLATRLSLDPATVSSVLKRLSDDGRVYRVDDQGPRGGFIYYVSPKEAPPSGKRTLVNVERAMQITAVSRRTIYHWLKAGKIEAVRTAGGNLRIYEDTLLQSSDAHTPKRLFTPPKARKTFG